MMPLTITASEPGFPRAMRAEGSGVWGRGGSQLAGRTGARRSKREEFPAQQAQLKNNRLISLLFICSLALLAAGSVFAQEWPSPITYFVTGSIQTGESARAVPLNSAQLVMSSNPDGPFVTEPLNPSFSTTGEPNRFMINGIDLPGFAPGLVVDVAAARFWYNNREYGSTRQRVTITGQGYTSLSGAVVIESIDAINERINQPGFGQEEIRLATDLLQQTCQLTPAEAAVVEEILLAQGLTQASIQNVAAGLRLRFPNMPESRIQCATGASGLLNRLLTQGFSQTEIDRILPPPPPQTPFGPSIRSIIIDGREYSAEVIQKFGKFYVGKNPALTASFQSGWGIDSNSIGIQIDGEKVKKRPLGVALTSIQPTQNAQQLNTGEYTVLTMNHTIAKEEALEDGAQTLTFRAGNRWGITTATASVTVTSHIGIERLVVGQRVGGVLQTVFQSSIGDSSPMIIAYTLTAPTDVEILIYGISGEILRRFTFNANENGGRADYNEFNWNGVTDMGTRVPNGVYVGMIINRDSNKLIQKFRFVVKD